MSSADKSGELEYVNGFGLTKGRPGVNTAGQEDKKAFMHPPRLLVTQHVQSESPFSPLDSELSL